MQHNRCGGKEWLACSGRSGYEVCVRFYSSLPHRRIARLLRSLRQRFPRPILIFVAASKNSPPATVVAKIGFARLRHCRGMQAGTGCHEGGIILSKKAAGVAPVPAATACGLWFQPVPAATACGLRFQPAPAATALCVRF